MLKLAVASTIMAFATINAQAGEVKPYIGIGLGSFTIDGGSVAGFSLKTNSSIGGFLQGGVDINPYIAAELRVGGVSSSKIKGLNGDKLKADWFASYLAKPQFSPTGGLNIYGLIGATTAKVSITNTAGQTASRTKTQLTFGAGLEYTIQDTVSIGAEYVQYSNTADFISNKVKITGISATVGYHF